MKTWITKLKGRLGRGLPVQLPALLLAAGGAFWLAYANPSGAFSMLAMLGAACLVFLTQLPRAAKYGWCALVLCVLLPLVGTRSSYFMDVATQVGMYVVLALGLNITVGYCGLFNLGYIAFYALGAYALWPALHESVPQLPRGRRPLPARRRLVLAVFADRRGDWLSGGLF